MTRHYDARMQYNLYRGADTIRADLLPHEGKSAFNYYHKAIITSFGLHSLFGAAAIAVFATFIMRCSGYVLSWFPGFGSQVLLIAITFFGVALASTFLFCEQDTIEEHGICFLWVLAFCLGVVACAKAPLLNFACTHVAAFVAIVVLSDSLLDRIIPMLSQHPRVSPDTAKEFLAFWKNRSNDDRYTGAFLGLGLVHLTLVLSFLSARSFLGDLVLASLITSAITAIVFLLLTFIVEPSTTRKVSSLFWNSFVYALAYEPHPFAAGLWRSEADEEGRGEPPLLACIFLIAASFIPSVSYLPLIACTPLGDDAMLLRPGDPHFRVSRRDSPIEEFLRARTRSELTNRTSRSEEAWILLMFFNGFKHAPATTAASYCVSVFACIVATTLLLLANLYILMVPVLAYAATTLGANEIAAGEAPWDVKIKRLHNSPYETDRESIYVGINQATGEPVLIPRLCYHRHAHLLGATQSGKTAAIASMLTQFIRLQARDRDAENPSQQSSVVVVDFKGDLGLFQNARIEAERNGIPFKFFNLSTGFATFAFNPFLQKNYRELASYERSNQLLESLALAHGLAYGRSFFSRSAESVLIPFLKEFGNSVASFRNLDDLLSGKKQDLLRAAIKLTVQEKTNASELVAAVKKLSYIEALNVTSATPGRAGVAENQIDFTDVFSRPQCVYFFMPTGRTPSLVTEIGRLVVFLLLDAATQKEYDRLRGRGSDVPHQVYLFIDEFQQILGETLSVFFEQASSKRIAVFASHQTVGQLTSATFDLKDTITGNTHVKQAFAASDLSQQRYLIEESGDARDQISDRDSDVEPVLRLQPRFRVNDIITMTATPNESIVRVTHPEGYAQYEGFSQRVAGEFHISKDEYIRRQSLTWPSESEYPGTFTPKNDVRDSGPLTASADSPYSSALEQALLEQEASKEQQKASKPKRKRNA